MRPQRKPGNWVYYFKIGTGTWEGEFTFSILNWSRFWKDSIGFWNHAFAVVLAVSQKLFGPSKIHSTMRGFSRWGPCGIAMNEMTIKQFGVTVYALRESYVLHPNGKDVYVHARERLGPVPFLFDKSKRHPARTRPDGMGTLYVNMPILGTLWDGDYSVKKEQNRIEALLSCRWASASETIIKKQTRNELPERQTRPIPKTVAQVIEILALHRDWCDAVRDKKAIFTHAYMTITRLFERMIPTTGFTDRTWITKLVVAFAQEYVEAVTAFDLGLRVPPAWEVVFHAMNWKKTSVLEDLVISMVAHIIYDLPLALRKIGNSGIRKESKIGDFHLANDILQAGIDEIQQETARRYNPFLRVLDRLGRDDEILTNYGIRISRGLAWYNCERLKVDFNGTVTSLESSVSVATKQILSPPFSLSFLFRVLRIVSNLTRRWSN